MIIIWHGPWLLVVKMALGATTESREFESGLTPACSGFLSKENLAKSGLPSSVG